MFNSFISYLVTFSTVWVYTGAECDRCCTVTMSKEFSNLADEVQTIMSRLSDDNEDFIQSVYVQNTRAPVIVLYSQNQIDDLRLLCSQDCPSNLRSVLSVDRTFNLSSLFVTVMVFRKRKVTRKCTQELLIFIGPIMLHGDGRYATYHHFFSHVNAALNGCSVDSSEIACDNFVTGSDEKLALVNAVKPTFHNTNQLYCMIHCKDNVRHHLTIIGVPSKFREQILTRLFGCNCVSESPDEETMDDRIADVMQYMRQKAADVVSYIQERILPKISGNNRVKWQESWLGKHQWTNNNCESANHLLKLQVRIIL